MNSEPWFVPICEMFGSLRYFMRNVILCKSNELVWEKEDKGEIQSNGKLHK